MDDMDLLHQISELKQSIALKNAVLADLDVEIMDIQRDLNPFQARYDSLVAPIEGRLEIVNAAISDLESELRLSRLGTLHPLESSWEPPPDYVSVEEQYRRTWIDPQPAADPDTITNRPPAAERPRVSSYTPHVAEPGSRAARIKKLYRTLARRYHPDLALDDAERARRNTLMARINDAYSQADLDALAALANRADLSPEESFDALRLEELRRLDDQLSDRIAQRQGERGRLIHSDLMYLWQRAREARRQGRDLLHEMAADAQREYDAALLRLEELRREQRGA